MQPTQKKWHGLQTLTVPASSHHPSGQYAAQVVAFGDGCMAKDAAQELQSSAVAPLHSSQLL